MPATSLPKWIADARTTFDPHWTAFGPPLVGTGEQCDEMLALLDRSLAEVLHERAV